MNPLYPVTSTVSWLGFMRSVCSFLRYRQNVHVVLILAHTFPLNLHCIRKHQSECTGISHPSWHIFPKNPNPHRTLEDPLHIRPLSPITSAYKAMRRRSGYLIESRLAWVSY